MADQVMRLSLDVTANDGNASYMNVPAGLKGGQSDTNGVMLKPTEQAAAAFSSQANIDTVMTRVGVADYDAGENALKCPNNAGLNVNGAYTTNAYTATGVGYFQIDWKNPGLNTVLGFASGAALNYQDSSGPKVLQDKIWGNTSGTAQTISAANGGITYYNDGVYHTWQFWFDQTSNLQVITCDGIPVWKAWSTAANLRLQISAWNAGDTYAKNFSANFGVSAASPVLTFDPWYAGAGRIYETIDMSTFNINENKLPFSGPTSIKYQYGYSTDGATITWNGSWLTLAQLQGETDLEDKTYFHLKMQINSAGALPGDIFDTPEMVQVTMASGGGGTGVLVGKNCPLIKGL